MLHAQTRKKLICYRTGNQDKIEQGGTVTKQCYEVFALVWLTVWGAGEQGPHGWQVPEKKTPLCP